MKASFINYDDLESLIEKMSTCHNNPEAKINKHTVSGFSYFQYSIDPKKHKLNFYGGKVCMKNFSKDWKEYASEIII